MESYQNIQSLAAKFSDLELVPLAAQIDREGEIPRNILKSFGENGFMGICVPQEYGGSGMDTMSYALITEEISRGCASCGVFLSAHNSLCLFPLMIWGTPEQKKTYLPPLAQGISIGCFCLSEPNAGSDAGSLTSFAEDKGDYYEVTGMKNFITNGREAHVAIVFAKTKKTDNYRGISAFVVETKSEGFQVMKCEDKLGIRGSSTAQISLDKVRVPKENVLGKVEKGFSMAMGTLDYGRIGIAAQAVGIAEAAFRYALKYAKERVQFGKPIGHFQGVQFMLADMSTKLAASRSLIFRAIRLKDAGRPFSKEAAQAKLFASESAMWVTMKAIQICGGNGYMKDYPVERHFRDAKITEIYEGTSEIQRLVIAQSELK